MAWYIKNTGELWTGPTHTLHGFTWTEATHMSYSSKLEEGPEPVKARTKRGTFKADDPSTPNVDESKSAPKRKRKKKDE